MRFFTNDYREHDRHLDQHAGKSARVPDEMDEADVNAERDQIGMAGDITADSRATSPGSARVVGLDGTAFAGSARASKLIGSKVYTGDTSIGQIEDILITLDHATVTAVILSVSGSGTS